MASQIGFFPTRTRRFQNDGNPGIVTYQPPIKLLEPPPVTEFQTESQSNIISFLPAQDSEIEKLIFTPADVKNDINDLQVVQKKTEPIQAGLFDGGFMDILKIAAPLLLIGWIFSSSKPGPGERRARMKPARRRTRTARQENPRRRTRRRR